jgi:hypothetical protein
MMDFIYEWPIEPIMFVLSVVAVIVSEVCYQAGRRRVQENDRAHSIIVTIRASIIGFVALLLGFSFSVTSSRYDERSRLVVGEASAIGTCYDRAGLLPEPARSRIRSALHHYIDLRLENFAHNLEPAEYRRTAGALDSTLAELWDGVTQAVALDRTMAFTSQIIPAANQLGDLHMEYNWAAQFHLPAAIVVLLCLSVVVAAAQIGQSMAESGGRHVGLWVALMGLVMMVVFVVLDLDRPTGGVIQVSQRAMIEVRDGMKQ